MEAALDAGEHGSRLTPVSPSQLNEVDGLTKRAKTPRASCSGGLGFLHAVFTGARGADTHKPGRAVDQLAGNQVENGLVVRTHTGAPADTSSTIVRSSLTALGYQRRGHVCERGATPPFRLRGRRVRPMRPPAL